MLSYGDTRQRQKLARRRQTAIPGAAMPTILREGPYRFYFVSGDRNEPPHIHVQRDNCFAKFWLDPVKYQDGGNFTRRESLRIYRIVERNHTAFLEAWNAHFNR